MTHDAEPEPAGQDFDSMFRAGLARFTGGLAPTAFASAWADWAMHLSLAPARQLEILQDAATRASDSWGFAARALADRSLAPDDGSTDASDPRFAADAWASWPFNVYARVHRNGAALAQGAVQGVRGVTDGNARLLGFAARMAADASSPANYLGSNPELLTQTCEQGGGNLVRGVENWLQDLRLTVAGVAPRGTEAFEVGKTVAVTPGRVVLRNELIELIEYAPTTRTTHAEPLLIVPAWIMKYYILDLSPRNSLVKYLVDQGHTVFMISWKNPCAGDRDLGIDDYVELGLRAALDAVTTIVPKRKVHAVGYCIGGTLLALGAAALAGRSDDRLASVTMLAAQTDFSEPGELASFINPGQLATLQASMDDKGVLESRQMGGAFALLRSQDLVWRPIVDNYLRGQREPMIDLMAWNADGTRMPARMHTEYLYRLYLNNELAANRFTVGGRRVRLSDIRVPMFVVGTETDHVAPWQSVYKIENLVRSDDFSFLLTSGGHNAGIVSGPVHPKRRYRVLRKRLQDPFLAPEDWLDTAALHQGSWWPAWQRWLAEHSGAQVKPPTIGAPAKGYAALEDAPGQYVRQR